MTRKEYWELFKETGKIEYYLEYKKLSFAEKLLSSDMSINEISYKAGFSDCSHFISAFKKQFGTTPHKYRKIRKNAE